MNKEQCNKNEWRHKDIYMNTEYDGTAINGHYNQHSTIKRKNIYTHLQMRKICRTNKNGGEFSAVREVG